MLVIQDAMGKKNRSWSQIDIDGLTISALLEIYDSVVVSVLDNTANTLSSLVINNLRLDPSAQFVDVASFLQLPTTNIDTMLVPHISLAQRNTVYSHTLYAEGLSAEVGDHTIHPDSESINEFSPDLIVRGTDRTPGVVYHTHLFTVNGLIHPSMYTNAGVYIKGGNSHLRVADDSVLGAINFSNVGNITQHPVDRTNIRAYQNGETEAKLALSDTLLINVPNLQAESNTIFLVISGYLLPLQGLYSVIGNEDIKLSLRDYPLLERLLSANDIKPKGTFLSTNGTVSVPDLLGDEGIRKLFDGEHTFVVSLDVPDLCIESEYLERTGLPGRYLIAKSPEGILFNNDGKVSEFEWGVYGEKVELFSRTEERRPYRFITADEQQLIINDDRDINAPTVIDDGKFVTYYTLDA